MRSGMLMPADGEWDDMMDSSNLNRITLIINLACLALGVLAYDLVATGNAVAHSVIATLVALVGSYFGAAYVSKRLSSSGPLDGTIASSSVIKVLMFFPVVLVIYEVVSLLVLRVPPQSVSWVHIAAAGAVGQNAEAVFRKTD